MGTFGNLRSSDGFYVGAFPPVTKMIAGHYEQAPELYSNSFGRFSFKEFGDPGEVELIWDDLYKNCVVSFPSMITTTDLALELQVRGATSQAYAKELFSIPTTLQNTNMCIMGWSDNSNIVRYAAYKRVLNPDTTYTYTSISATLSLYDNSGSDGIYAVAGKFYMDNVEFYGFGLASKEFFPRTNKEQIEVPLFVGTEVCFRNIFGGDPEEEPYSPEFGPGAQPGGGYIPGGGGTPTDPAARKVPTFDNTSDKITVDTKPTKSPLDGGFVHEYIMQPAELAHMAEALFIDFDWTTPDIPKYLKNLCEALINNKRIDFILDFMIMPVQPSSGTLTNVLCGGKPLEYLDIYSTSAYVKGVEVDDPFVDFDCESLSIDEYWVNFLDFTGTRIKLFLPYVGYVDIQPEYVIGGTLHVWYRFNTLDGSFMCYVESTSGYSQLEESLIAQYAGVAAIHVPIQSEDYSNRVAGLISAIGVLGAASMGAVGVAGGIGAGANLTNTMIQKSQSVHGNGYNASSSYLSHRTPYLIIERQWAQFSEKYPEEVGVPSNVMCRIGDLTGLVKSQNAHLDVIPCNKEVKDLIAGLLADGIIVG